MLHQASDKAYVILTLCSARAGGCVLKPVICFNLPPIFNNRVPLQVCRSDNSLNNIKVRAIKPRNLRAGRYDISGSLCAASPAPLRHRRRQASMSVACKRHASTASYCLLLPPPASSCLLLPPTASYCSCSVMPTQPPSTLSPVISVFDSGLTMEKKKG